MKRSTRLALFLIATFAVVATAAWGREAPARAADRPAVAAPTLDPLVLRRLPSMAKFCKPDEIPCTVTLGLGDINDGTAERFAFYFQASEIVKADAILVVIDSPGGEVEAGSTIRQLIKTSKVPVHCLANDITASVAFWIYQTCPSRYITKGTRLVTHRAFIRKMEDAQVEDLLKAAAVLVRINSAQARDIGARMQITPEAWLKRVTARDWEIKADKAVALHAADAVFKDAPAAIAYVTALYLAPHVR